MHQPIVRSAFRRRDGTTKPLAPLSRETMRRVSQRWSRARSARSGVVALGPDPGALRLGEAQAPEHVAGGAAVLDAGGRHRDHQGQAERGHGDVLSGRRRGRQPRSPRTWRYRLEAAARSWKHTATSAAFLLRPLDTFLAPDPAKSKVNKTS